MKTFFITAVLTIVLTLTLDAQSLVPVGFSPVAGSAAVGGGKNVSFRIGNIGFFTVEKSTVKEDVLTKAGNEILPVKISAYPNPFADELRVAFPSFTPQNIEIQFIDMAGRTTNVKDFVYDGSDVIVIRTDRLKAGHYIIKVSSGRNSYKLKVVKL